MGNVRIHRSSTYWEMGLEALDFKNYVAVNYTLIRKYGLHVAVLIGELASEARYYKNKGQLKDGWFFSTVENIENHTGLNAYYQREAIKVVQDLGIVETKYSGLPRKRYFRVDAMRIIEEMSDAEETAVDGQSFTQLTTSDQYSEPLEAYPVNDNNCNEQLKQTTKKKNICHPTIEEVKAHVQEKGYHFDPQHFFDYYEASGWHFANGKPVKSWKQCCVTWERNAKPKEAHVTERDRIDLGLDRYGQGRVDASDPYATVFE